MLQKERKERDQLEFVSIEALVPKDHLLRKIDSAVDFNKIYDFVEDLYCPDNGRPSIDPVFLHNGCIYTVPHGIKEPKWELLAKDIETYYSTLFLE